METVDVGEEMANLFDPTTNLYTQTIFLCLILLGFGIVCGIFYELIRRRRNARRVKPQSKKHFYSTSLHSTPLHSTPLHSTPLHFTPLHSTSLQQNEWRGIFKLFYIFRIDWSGGDQGTHWRNAGIVSEILW